MNEVIKDLKRKILELKPHDISKKADLEGMYYMAINDVCELLNDFTVNECKHVWIRNDPDYK